MPIRITTHSNKLNEFIKTSMASKHILKVNNFGNKNKSFTKALTELKNNSKSNRSTLPYEEEEEKEKVK